MHHRLHPLLATAILLLGLLGCAGLQAEAPVEKPARVPDRPLTVYLVLTPQDSRNEMLVERFHLPSALTALAWTRFTLQGSGNVELEALGGYRILSRKPVLEQSIGDYGIYGYELALSYSGRGAYAPKRTFTLTFDYRSQAAGGGVVIQPAHRALLEGIRRSGRQTGIAKVLELRYQGAGKFTARVGVL
jgi:hypothetical protein